MNKKWNKRRWYTVIFFSLSILSFASRSFWIMAISNSSFLDGFDRFVYKTFGWPTYPSVDVAFFGPVILGAILLLFAAYFEKTSSGEKNTIFSIIRAAVAFLVILICLAIWSMLISFGIY